MVPLAAWPDRPWSTVLLPADSLEPGPPGLPHCLPSALAREAERVRNRPAGPETRPQKPTLTRATCTPPFLMKRVFGCNLS